MKVLFYIPFNTIYLPFFLDYCLCICLLTSSCGRRGWRHTSRNSIWKTSDRTYRLQTLGMQSNSRIFREEFGITNIWRGFAWGSIFILDSILVIELYETVCYLALPCRLERHVYESVLKSFLESDVNQFQQTLKDWPTDLYNNKNLIPAVAARVGMVLYVIGVFI